MGPRSFFACVLAGGFLAAPGVLAQSASTGSVSVSTIKVDEKDKLIWRGTSFSWNQSASGQTVGLGQDYQSRNPTYDMTFSLGPHLFIYDDKVQSLNVQGGIGAGREFTNSDSTTKRGEWSLTDASLTMGYSRTLFGQKKDDEDEPAADKAAAGSGYSTSLGFLAPNLTFPTSKAAANNGTILGTGATLSLTQGIPIRGPDADILPSFTLVGSAGYSHTFTEAVVPTNDELQRVRLGPNGEALPGDQLGGAAYARHKASFGFGTGLAITKRITWKNSFNWSPVWKYNFARDVEICGVVLTGCTTPTTVNDPQDFSVITLFSTSFSVNVMDELSLSLAYTNATLQLGPDGQRRNIFYSPSARVSLGVSVALDELYKTIRGPKDEKVAKRRAEVAGR